MYKAGDEFVLFWSVFQLISRRRFQQIDVLEGINVLISISGKESVFTERSFDHLVLD